MGVRTITPSLGRQLDGGGREWVSQVSQDLGFKISQKMAQKCPFWGTPGA